MGTLKAPETGDEFPMSYEDFHCLLDGTETRDPHDGDPCEALFGHGAPSMMWPALSYLNAGDMDTNTWMYDHLRSVAIWGSLGAWIEENPEEDEDEEDEEDEDATEDSDEEDEEDENATEDSDEEECLT